MDRNVLIFFVRLLRIKFKEWKAPLRATYNTAGNNFSFIIMDFLILLRHILNEFKRIPCVTAIRLFSTF